MIPITIYHGTPREEIAELIMEEGLRGGDNTIGGNRGTWDVPLLFTSPYREVAEKYGAFIIEIEIDPKDLPDRINDGLGDPCYVFEGEGILITPDILRCELLDHQWGVCGGCPYCSP